MPFYDRPIDRRTNQPTDQSTNQQQTGMMVRGEVIESFSDGKGDFIFKLFIPHFFTVGFIHEASALLLLQFLVRDH